MPPANYVITESSEVRIGGTPCFRVVFLRDDGLLHGHFFPTETLIWRAVELGLDPDADRETVLDILLHEPWVTDDPAPAALASGLASQHPHLARVADAKTRVNVTTRAAAGAPDPLDTIRRHPIDPGRVREIQDRVNGVRPPEPPIDDSSTNRHDETPRGSR